MNTFGNIFRLTSFGESHGPAIGGVIDGCPAGVRIDFDAINRELERRRPGSSANVSQRDEPDTPEFLSGFSPDGITLGTPIGFIIRNRDHRPDDYSELADKFRPNHADYTYQRKYHIRDHRGGGRGSARETAVRVTAGAIAAQILRSFGIRIEARITSIGGIPVSSREEIDRIVEPIRKEGDSVGGMIEGVITGLPPGLGEPVFGKLHAMLASAMMSINAAKGFDYGLGMNSASAHGLETIDSFRRGETDFITTTNFSGGIQGGISNGMPVTFRVAFKPTPTVLRPVETIDMTGRETILAARGRHDPCVALRAVPVVEGMAAIVCLDALLLNRSARL